MKNKSPIINILILTMMLISPVGIIAGGDPLETATSVDVDAPDTVSVGDTFNATININNAVDFPLCNNCRSRSFRRTCNR